MTITGLFYPLAVTASGDIQAADTTTEDLISSYCQYLLDTEAGLSVFEQTGSDVLAEEVQRFRFLLQQKTPLINFDVRARWEGRVLLLDIAWTESGVDRAVTVELASLPA